ncbi:MAG: stress responsive alpha-beta barrel domain-containing protein [Desulfuromonas sp.]|uniref:Dabb family protein n=1 Tax=Desulfuromonas sp. TaxID=892 RepID=UPI000CC61798|nr:Dabb family protein [Desulfuromonas sp.]PLX84171.1 MAG: stress responsive alpha-beta barrel domain-containing protein [Desulfuromonas sp.]
MLRHVVFMKFKPETAAADIEAVEKGLAGLPATIAEIAAFEFGRDVVRSERSYDFALVSSFADLDAMQRYQGHPDHLAVVEKIKPICSSVLAVDFEV